MLPEKKQSEGGQRGKNYFLSPNKLLKALIQTELQISKGISLPSQIGILLKGQEVQPATAAGKTTGNKQKRSL